MTRNRDVPNHGRRWLKPAFDVTASLRVGVGTRKPAGGWSWLFRCTLVLNDGLNAPAATATRVSLICGSRRSAFKSGLFCSASRTASSTVSRSVAGRRLCRCRGRQSGQDEVAKYFYPCCT